MQIRTFKEKFKEQYFRNRNLEGRVHILLPNDIERLIGSIIFIKATEREVNDIYSLRNLAYIHQIVYLDGYVTGFMVRRIITNDTDAIEFETYSLRQIKVITKNVLMQNWFLESLETVVNTTVARDRIPSYLNTLNMLPMKLNIPVGFSNIFLVDVYKGFIESLTAKLTTIATIRNTILITNEQAHERPYSVIELTSREGMITDFLYKNSQ